MDTHRRIILDYLVENERGDTIVSDILAREGLTITETPDAYMNRFNLLRGELFKASADYAKFTVDTTMEAYGARQAEKLTAAGRG